MTINHSCWPLFGDDLAMARDWIKLRLSSAPIDVRIGHQALSLELLHGTSRYATHLTLLRNQVFGNWKPCIGTLIQILLGKC